MLLNWWTSAVTDQIKGSKEIWKEDMQKTAFAFCKHNWYQESMQMTARKAPAMCQLGQNQSRAAANTGSVTSQEIYSLTCPLHKWNTWKYGWGWNIFEGRKAFRIISFSTCPSSNPVFLISLSAEVSKCLLFSQHAHTPVSSFWKICMVQLTNSLALALDPASMSASLPK